MPKQVKIPHLKHVSRKCLFSIKYCLTLLIIAYCSVNVQAQLPSETSVSWQLLDNNTANGNALTKFVIHNNTKKAIEKSGWSLLFNYMRSIDLKSVKPPYQLTHENGDLYRLSFLNDFKGIAPSDSIVIPFSLKGKIINFSDAPSGLYFAYNDPKIPGQTIKNYTVIPYKGDQKEQLKVLAAQYELNKKFEEMANTAKLRIIPAPQAIKQYTGNFTLSAQTSLSFDERFKKEAENLSP